MSPLHISNALQDYAERLKTANLRVWTNNGFLLERLVFSNGQNAAEVRGSSSYKFSGFTFYAPHRRDASLNHSLVVSKAEIPLPVDILSMDAAVRALAFFDSGEAERSYGFSGERHPNGDAYVKGNGRLLREL